MNDRSHWTTRKGQIGMDRVLLEVGSGVALITVNDADRRNAVTDEISTGLRVAVNDAQNDPNVHAVVVTGAGKAFCAGADLSALGAAAEDGLRRLYDGFLAVAECALPPAPPLTAPPPRPRLHLPLPSPVRL